MQHIESQLSVRGANKTRVACLYFRVLGCRLLYFFGGRAHFGALTFSLNFKNTVYSFTCKRPHHRDDVVTKAAARFLAGRVTGINIVVAGIHYDNINQNQIRGILKNCTGLTKKVATPKTMPCVSSAKAGSRIAAF